MTEPGQYVVSLQTTSYKEAKEEALKILSKTDWTESHLRKKKNDDIWEMRYRIPNNPL